MGCNSCGSVKSKVDIVRQASLAMVEGHLGLARVYREIANDVPESEKQAFLLEAHKQEMLARETGNIVVPQSITDKDLLDEKAG